jgi:hypothetical protein
MERRWPVSRLRFGPVVLRYAIEELGHSQAEIAAATRHRLPVRGMCGSGRPNRGD